MGCRARAMPRHREVGGFAPRRDQQRCTASSRARLRSITQVKWRLDRCAPKPRSTAQGPVMRYLKANTRSPFRKRFPFRNSLAKQRAFVFEHLENRLLLAVDLKPAGGQTPPGTSSNVLTVTGDEAGATDDSIV